MIEGQAHGRVGGDAAGAVGAAADGAHHELAQGHGHARDSRDALTCLGHPGPASLDGRAGTAGLLDDQRVHRTAGGSDLAGQLRPVEALATQRHEQHGADVGMGREALQHHGRVVVGVAAAEPDDVDIILVAGADARSHVMGTLHGVDHGHHIADALAPVGTEIAFHGGHASPRA